MSTLCSLWAFRGFILGGVQREFQSRYRNSLLGWIWLVLNPLSMIVIYTVIFSQVMQTRLPTAEGKLAYSIYLCVGVLTWGLFTEILTRFQNVFLDNANLIKKLNFPRLCLPVTLVLSALLNFGITFTIFLGFLGFCGQFPSWNLWLIIPTISIQLLLAVGLGIILGIFNVFFRDIGHLFNIVLNLWFWCTPIVYPASILPKPIAQLMEWNPMATLIGTYQSLFLNGTVDLSRLLPVLILSLLLCCTGYYLFHRHSGEIVDEL